MVSSDSKGNTPYSRAIAYLYGRINYERSPASLGEFKLQRMEALLEKLGAPHQQIPVIHIAGTKGKGSTARVLAEILQASGTRTGLFTSPHLHRVEERFQVDGHEPSAEELVQLVTQIEQAILTGGIDFDPTFFELTTAIAWLYFLQKKVQIAVIEVGLGGRLDTTNVCHPLVTAITTISRDHTAILGSELSQIAAEKGGIIKEGIPVICGACPIEAIETIREIASSKNAPMWQMGEEYRFEIQGKLLRVETPIQQHEDLPLVLEGEHQAHNAAIAVAIIDCLVSRGWSRIGDAIKEGMSQVRWPGRIERVHENPTILVDAAHNWAAARALAKTIQELEAIRIGANNEQVPTASNRILIFAASRDKDINGMLRTLLPLFSTIILTPYTSNPRFLPVEELLAKVRGITEVPPHLASSPAEALGLALRFAKRTDLICATGSLFLAGEIRELVLNQRASNE